MTMRIRDTLLGLWKSTAYPAPRPTPMQGNGADMEPQSGSATPSCDCGPEANLEAAGVLFEPAPVSAHPASKMPCPPPERQARQFLSWLKKRYAGRRVFAHHLQGRFSPASAATRDGGRGHGTLSPSTSRALPVAGRITNGWRSTASAAGGGFIAFHQEHPVPNSSEAMSHQNKKAAPSAASDTPADRERVPSPAHIREGNFLFRRVECVSPNFHRSE